MACIQASTLITEISHTATTVESAPSIVTSIAQRALKNLAVLWDISFNTPMLFQALAISITLVLASYIHTMLFPTPPSATPLTPATPPLSPDTSPVPAPRAPTTNRTPAHRTPRIPPAPPEEELLEFPLLTPALMQDLANENGLWNPRNDAAMTTSRLYQNVVNGIPVCGPDQNPIMRPSLQCSFVPERGQPLGTRVCPATQRADIPLIGRYNPHQYEITHPHVLLRLSPEMLNAALPESIRTVINSDHAQASSGARSSANYAMKVYNALQVTISIRRAAGANVAPLTTAAGALRQAAHQASLSARAAMHDPSPQHTRSAAEKALNARNAVQGVLMLLEEAPSNDILDQARAMVATASSRAAAATEYPVETRLIKLAKAREAMENARIACLAVQEHNRVEDGNIDSYLSIHSRPDRYHGGDEINLVLHGWMYPDIDMGFNARRDDRTDNTLIGRPREHPVGIFERTNIEAGANLRIDAPSSAAPIDRLGPTDIYTHDRVCSTNNVRFRVVHNDDHRVSEFWSVAQREDGRYLISHQLLVTHQSVETLMRNAVANSNNLSELTTYLNAHRGSIPQRVINQLTRSFYNLFPTAPAAEATATTGGTADAETTVDDEAVGDLIEPHISAMIAAASSLGITVGGE